MAPCSLLSTTSQGGDIFLKNGPVVVANNGSGEQITADSPESINKEDGLEEKTSKDQEDNRSGPLEPEAKKKQETIGDDDIENVQSNPDDPE